MRALVAALACALLVPAASLPSGAAADRAATASGTKVCSWKWKRKKVVRWVKRRGETKRVVRYRKVKVKRCREVPVPAPARLGVGAWEFGFTLSAKELRAGDTIVELNNRGEDAHDLHVQRIGGGPELATPEVEPGRQSRVRLVTQPGSYRLWCALPNHAVWGMDTIFEAVQSPSER